MRSTQQLSQLEGLRQRLRRWAFALPARRARPAPLTVNLLKTLIQGLLMALVFLVVGSALVWHLETFLLQHGWPLPRVSFFPASAIALFAIGAIVAWTSAWMLVRFGDGTPLPLDATSKLVVRGPYRWVRNPMACASLLEGIAIGLFLGSPLVLLYVVAGGILWNFSARPWEEHDMRTQFGEDFRGYEREVRCWIPRLRPYSPTEAVLPPAQTNPDER